MFPPNQYDAWRLRGPKTTPEYTGRYCESCPDTPIPEKYVTEGTCAGCGRVFCSQHLVSADDSSLCLKCYGTRYAFGNGSAGA